MQTEQFKKSLAMMECNQWAPEDSDREFQDYSLYVYRQTAPEFVNRVKELEMKLLYPVRQLRIVILGVIITIRMRLSFI